MRVVQLSQLAPGRISSDRGLQIEGVVGIDLMLSGFGISQIGVDGTPQILNGDALLGNEVPECRISNHSVDPALWRPPALSETAMGATLATATAGHWPAFHYPPR